MNRPQILKTESKDFVDMIKHINQIRDENILVFDKEGLKIKNMDNGMITTFDIFLPKSGFDEYKIEKNIKIGINTKNLLNILKNVNRGDFLKLSLNEEKTRLIIGIDGKFTQNHSVPILDIKEADLPDTKSLEFSHEFRIPTEDLQKLTRDNKNIENIHFEGRDGKLVIKFSESYEESTSEIKTEYKIDSNVVSKYSTGYLYKLTRFLPKKTTTIVKFGKDYPLKLFTSVPDRIGYTSILAPRVED